MGRGKRKTILRAGASGSKEKHKRAQRAQFGHLAPAPAPAPEGLVAKLSVPKSRHHTYFEFVENKDKKKKLEVQVTRSKTPPPGFEFVPIGNPVLTSACKELSREGDAMVFIVSSVATNSLSQQVNRLGHHIRQTIVEAARESIAHLPQSGAVTPDGKPEPIPESQEEYHAQADAALRDLFPRIPNTDRQIIIEHAFTRRTNGKGEQPVGFSDDIPLARRVQLAVLAHIRHAHTRYDDLLKEAGWQMARRAVEELCLDIIVKWRGDEETGRDQLDEILREVVIISDSEDDGSDAETADDPSTDDSDSSTSVVMVSQQPVTVTPLTLAEHRHSPEILASPGQTLVQARGRYTIPSIDHGPRASRRDQRGFKRYRAWQDAIMRNREPRAQHPASFACDTGEYDPLHPLIQFQSNESSHREQLAPQTAGRLNRVAEYQVSNSIRNMCSPSDSRREDSPPPFIPLAAEVQPSSDGGPTTLANEFQTNGPSSSRLVSPITHRLRDMLVHSIEPASPDTMKPAFIRAVPPRNHDAAARLHTRTQEIYRHTSDHVETINTFRDNLASPGCQPVASDQSRIRMPYSNVVNDGPFYVAPAHTEGSFHGNVGQPDSPLHVGSRILNQPGYDSTPRADRIVINASRPGTLSNPILMEDRGGFYERVQVIQDSRLVHGDERNSAPLKQEPFTATQSYRMVSDEGSQKLYQDEARSGVQTVPLPWPGPVPHAERLHNRPHIPSHPIPPHEVQPASLSTGFWHRSGPHPCQRWSSQQHRPIHRRLT